MTEEFIEIRVLACNRAGVDSVMRTQVAGLTSLPVCKRVLGTPEHDRFVSSNAADHTQSLGPYNPYHYAEDQREP